MLSRRRAWARPAGGRLFLGCRRPPLRPAGGRAGGQQVPHSILVSRSFHPQPFKAQFCTFQHLSAKVGRGVDYIWCRANAESRASSADASGTGTAAASGLQQRSEGVSERLPAAKRRRVAPEEGEVAPVTGPDVMLRRAWSAVIEPLEGSRTCSLLILVLMMPATYGTILHQYLEVTSPC